MSLLRASTCARSFAHSSRRYATAPGGQPSPKSSNLPLYLMGAGIAGLLGYQYLNYNHPEQASKGSLSNLVQAGPDQSPLNPKEFIELKLKEARPYNWNTTTYIFEIPNNEPSRLPISSCVLLRSADAESLKDQKGNPVARPYTPTSPSDAPGVLEFVIKRYEQGLMSQHIHSLKPGDSIAVKGPIQKFPYQTNQFEEIGMIAGGSGITPMYQVLQHALSQPDNQTKFKLIFGNVEERDILLKDEFDVLKKNYPNNFDVVHVLDKPPKGWQGSSGFITKDLLQQHFGGPAKKEKIKILVCGPPGQVAAIAGKKDGMKQGELGGALKELGYEENQVFKF